MKEPVLRRARNAAAIALAIALAAGGTAAVLSDPDATAYAAEIAPPASPQPTPLSAEDLAIARYGMYPLPIKPEAIEHFAISNKDLRLVAAAKSFANTPKARSVRTCESDGDYELIDRSYYGAWQFDRETWQSNGGGRFAPTANLAPPWAQDFIMWRTHQAYGWTPWTCA